MTGRAYMGEVLNQLSLAEIHQEMSGLLDKQVNAQKEKNFQGSPKRLQTHEKVCNEQTRKMTCA